MINDDFHQTVSIFLYLDRTYTSGQMNRMLKGLGAKIHYDVYSFERADVGPIWQSESLVYVVLYCDDVEVDAQSSSNKLELQYPLATLGSEHISKFAMLVKDISDVFGAKPTLNGKVINEAGIIEHCEELATDLMESWGEEPGSETLRIMIESCY